MNAQAARIRLISSMVIFGTIGLFVKGIALPSSIIAMARGLMGMLFLFLLAQLRGRKISFSALRSSGPLLLLSGALIGFNWIFLFESYRYTTVATATLCYYLAPILVVLTSPVFLREKLTGLRILCVVLAFAGMVFVSGVAENGLPPISELRGVLLALCAAMLYAAVMILNKRIRGITTYDRTLLQIGMAGIILVPYCLLTAHVTASSLDMQSILLLLFVGIVHTGISYYLYFGSVDYLSGQSISMLSYIDPVVAILCSVLILREPFNVYSFIGAVLVLTAAIVSELPSAQPPVE